MIKLFVVDALKALFALPEASIDCIVSSPPYNLGTEYEEFDDTMPRDEYLAWTAVWAEGVRHVLKPTGSLFLNVAGKPSDPWVPYDVAQVFRQHFTLQNDLHWIKSIAIEGETYGHYKPINSKRFVNDCHECLFHFTLDGQRPVQREAIGVRYKDLSNLQRWLRAGRSQVHCRGNTWFIPYLTRNKRGSHVCPFPEQLVEWSLKLHGLPPKELREEFWVLDPFIGSGTTAKVAAKLGCSCVGFEICSEYLTEAAAVIQHQHAVPVKVALRLPEPGALFGPQETPT